MPNVFAYYLWPPVWVGTGAPEGYPDIDVRVLSEETYREELPVGVSVRCLRGGMFVFDFSKWGPGKDPGPEEPWDRNAALTLTNRRIAVYNTHLVSLNSALNRRQNINHPIMVVGPTEVIRLESFDGFQMGTRDVRIGALLSAQFPSTYHPNLPTALDWRLSSRTTTIESATIKASFELLSAVLGHSKPDILLLSDLHCRSCNAFQESNFNLCLTISWAVTEKLLTTLWDEYLEKNRTREIEGANVAFINKERKQTFDDHRSFTASVIAEVLSLNDILPFALYRDLYKVRKARNKWLHQLAAVAWDDALLSVKLAERMLNLVEGLDFDASIAFSY